jgi:hypothetical protein
MSKKKLKEGDRVDCDGDKGTVIKYIYPHFHPDGLIEIQLDNGGTIKGNASDINKIK